MEPDETVFTCKDEIFAFPKYAIPDEKLFVLMLCELIYNVSVIPPPPNAVPDEKVSKRISDALSMICGIAVSVSLIVAMFNDFTVCVALYRVR
jgi:hypothetical protein